MATRLPQFISLRNIGFALICLCAFAIWFCGRTSVSFLDDILFSSDDLTGLKSPVDIFVPGSAHFRSWPVGATLIWTLAALGINTISSIKTIGLLLHVANTFLMRALMKPQTSPEKADLFSLLYLVHPALFLSLSWAWQTETFLSVFFLLSALVCFQKRSTKFDIATAVLYLLSLLTKPWSVLLIPYFIVVTAMRVRKNRNQLAALIVVTILMSLLTLRLYKAARFDERHFPGELFPHIQFSTGTDIIHEDPTHPFPFDLSEERLHTIPTEITVFQSTLDVTSTPTRYALMASGVDEPVIEKRDDYFNMRNVFGVAIIVGFATLAGIAIKRIRRGEPNGSYMLFAIWTLFAGWFPHSGIVYSPHFKFSFTSPHYFVLMLPGVILCLDALANEFKSKWIPRMLVAMIAVAAYRQINLYHSLNTDIESQTKACPVMIKPWRGCIKQDTMRQ